MYQLFVRVDGIAYTFTYNSSYHTQAVAHAIATAMVIQHGINVEFHMPYGVDYISHTTPPKGWVEHKPGIKRPTTTRSNTSKLR